MEHREEIGYRWESVSLEQKSEGKAFQVKGNHLLKAKRPKIKLQVLYIV